jgi:hypothetical protein
MPPIPEWVQLVLGGSLLVGLAAVLTVFATRKRDKTTDVQERFESSSDLARYMREEIAKEVERQVAPIRRELDKVTAESHVWGSRTCSFRLRSSRGPKCR